MADDDTLPAPSTSAPADEPSIAGPGWTAIVLSTLFGAFLGFAFASAKADNDVKRLNDRIKALEGQLGAVEGQSADVARQLEKLRSRVDELE